MTDLGEIVLASTSPYRRAQLSQLGLAFRWRAPACDEEAFKAGFSGDPRELALALAAFKAESLANDEPDATLIGGDQVVAFDGQILGKPGNADRAVDQLFAMSGRSHDLISAAAVWSRGRTWTHVEVARLRLRELDREAISRVVLSDQSWDCAGGYKVEGQGLCLFDSIETGDPSAIIGLPLIGLVSILRKMRYMIP
jgi:septum formation protein